MEIGISLPVRELQDDLSAIKDFAQVAEELGFTHLRVPDLLIRSDGGPLHEPLTLLSWLAGATERIGLVPSVIILPARPTVLVAKQAATVDILSAGRLRLGVGVGGSREEYDALGQDFTSRGRRCDEQIDLLRRLWTEETVDFQGGTETLARVGIAPRPVQQPIPIWIGPGSGGDGGIAPSVLRRVGERADGWFAILPREQLASTQARIAEYAIAAGRDPVRIGVEGAVPVAGRDAEDWLADVDGWQDAGATHLCLRTLGAGLDAAGHVSAMREAAALLTDR
jgi:probable F420-dependent oxidoreductase